NLHFRKEQTPMFLNRVILIGFTGRDAKTSATAAGKNMTKLSVATTKRYRDGQERWQEKTQWHDCIAYGQIADYVAKVLTGTHVLIEGELTHREYERTIETDNGPVKVEWPITEVVIETLKVLDRKPEKGAAA